MIAIIDGFRIQTPELGNILKWEDSYSYEVALGEGMPEWDEVLDTGQIEPVQAEIVE